MENFEDSICVSSYFIGSSSLCKCLARTVGGEQVGFGFVITTQRGYGRSLKSRPGNTKPSNASIEYCPQPEMKTVTQAQI